MPVKLVGALLCDSIELGSNIINYNFFKKLMILFDFVLDPLLVQKYYKDICIYVHE